MIDYLPHKEIDKKKWDQAISNASHGIVYASSWYLDIVSPGWDALIEDDYTSVFPLTHHKKYGVVYLRQPHFTQQLGVFGEKAVSESTIQKYLAAAAGKFRFIEINLNTGNRFSSRDFKTREMLTHHLNLDKAYDVLYKNYSGNLQRNISRATKAGIELNAGEDENKIISLFRQNRGKEISSLKTKDYELLKDIVTEARKRNLAEVIVANTSSGAICAGAIFIKSFDKIIFLFSATSSEGKKLGAMSMLIDHVIKANASKNLMLDFEGSIDKNLARFYKSFASKEAVYLRIQRNNLPKFVRWLKK